MNITSLQDQVAKYRDSFNNAQPFRHLIIDNFLEEDFIEDILAQFPKPDAMDIHGSDAKRLLGKQINPKSPNYIDKPIINQLFNYLKSAELRQIFREISGISSKLVSDPDYYGSGLLLASRGGVHKVHADRTYHPNPCFHPRLVFLMYFNKDWKPSYGGGLQLWDRNIKDCVTIAPVFNRCVVFEITSVSYHSIEDVTCPDNVYRRALNYYYLSDEAAPNSYVHDTMFFPRPNERIAYWRNCALTNFPTGLISTLASRSSVSRKLYSAVRTLAKRKTSLHNAKLQSDQEMNRWIEFNS